MYLYDREIETDGMRYQVLTYVCIRIRRTYPYPYGLYNYQTYTDTRPDVPRNPALPGGEAGPPDLAVVRTLDVMPMDGGEEAKEGHSRSVHYC